MSRILRGQTVILIVILTAGSVSAATPQEINAAIGKGSSYLRKAMHASGEGELGVPAMIGLALLETGVPFDDPALKDIATRIRTDAFTVTGTYHVALALLFLDRYGDPNDVPLIQMLGARILFGQTPIGGWTYSCGEVPEAEARFLRERLKGGGAGVKLEPGKLHPDVAQYLKALAARPRQPAGDDNSNTQFGLLALWASRKHGIPADSALDLVVERFIRTQNPNTGGWPYASTDANDGSPSMTCAGLLGLATGYARREERLLKIADKEKDKKPDLGTPSPMTKSDPFFTPPTKTPPKGPAKPPPDRLDFAVSRGMANLGAVLARSAQLGRGRLVHDTSQHGHADLYFFWSLERVGVIYGFDKIGGIDWYAAGAETIVRLQNADGSWPESGGGGVGVATSFALLFLTKSNVVRDLSQRVQKTEVELRGGAGPGDAKATEPKESTTTSAGNPVEPKPRLILPIPLENESGRMALDLVQSGPNDWDAKLRKLRDTRGRDHTQALVIAIPRLDPERQAEARDALAERLTRMTPETLRQMMKADDPELRRGAVLAAAMKDDKTHIPDLIDRLLDDDDLVVRAARAGLKSLSDGKDFGPVRGATRLDREAAVKNWRQWWASQNK